MRHEMIDRLWWVAAARGRAAGDPVPTWPAVDALDDDPAALAVYVAGWAYGVAEGQAWLLRVGIARWCELPGCPGVVAEGDCCPSCCVYSGDPCPDCGHTQYHAEGCPMIEQPC